MISDSFPAEKSPGEGSRVQNQAAEISDNEAIDPKKESRLLRKIDIHLLLPLWVIFLFGFLDRINLGNAAVLGDRRGTEAQGIAAMCQGFVKNNAGLIACRFFIGVFEAGYVPGCAYLMAMQLRSSSRL
ncbi:hypothetical protein PABG_02032 [Paracoccidioides brasiliensis Pb03]|nr:hypothetical protein PABG_02032 [Paracoccidioides brasiliensis Pb03]